MADTHPWGIPVTMPAPSGVEIPIIPWSQLKFNPVGLYCLRRHQGVFPRIPGFFLRNQVRFEAADIAWFAAGMSNDDSHGHSVNNFHPLFMEFFEKSDPKKAENKALVGKVERLLLDVLTLFDRITGGTTMMLNMKGSARPGTIVSPEYLKALVYLPPAFVHNHRDLHDSILHITQTFIETIGTRTVSEWARRAGIHLGWSFSQTGTRTTSNGRTVRLIPYAKATEIPIPGTGDCALMIPGHVPSLPVDLDTEPTAPSSSLDSYGYSNHIDPAEQHILRQTERICELEGQVDELSRKNIKLQADIRKLEAQLGLFSGDEGPFGRSISPATPTRVKTQPPSGSPTHHRYPTPSGSSKTPSRHAHVPFIPSPSFRLSPSGFRPSPAQFRPSSSSVAYPTTPSKGKESAVQDGALVSTPVLTLFLKQNDLDHLEYAARVIIDGASDDVTSELVKLGIPAELVQKVVTLASLDVNL